MRSDTLRNRRRLLRAVYWYFPSVADLLDAYMTSVIEELRDNSHASRRQGLELLTDVARQLTAAFAGAVTG